VIAVVVGATSRGGAPSVIATPRLHGQTASGARLFQTTTFKSLAAMCRAVGAKPLMRFKNLPLHASALGLGHQEFRMVFPDQPHKSFREGRECADQVPTAFFETFSFGAVCRS